MKAIVCILCLALAWYNGIQADIAYEDGDINAAKVGYAWTIVLLLVFVLTLIFG